MCSAPFRDYTRHGGRGSFRLLLLIHMMTMLDGAAPTMVRRGTSSHAGADRIRQSVRRPIRLITGLLVS
jgi:hypothetical protein